MKIAALLGLCTVFVMGCMGGAEGQEYGNILAQSDPEDEAQSEGADEMAELGFDDALSAQSPTIVSALPPPIPNPLVKEPEYCYGFHTIKWSAQASATEYQLYRSLKGTFTDAYKIYSGPSTETWINVTAGTWYFRARACNASGCSGWTNIVSATRVNGCM